MKLGNRGLLEIAFLGLLSFGCDRAVELTRAPIPGNVLGILVLFALLSLDVVRLDRVAEGADFLIAHLSLFFVPAVVAAFALVGPLRTSLLGIATVTIVTTALVMLVTGRTAEALESKRDR